MITASYVIHIYYLHAYMLIYTCKMRVHYRLWIDMT